jgi:hypothetical protein
METEGKFKFSTFWVTFLSFFTFIFIYESFKYITLPPISWGNLMTCLLPILLAYLFLPITFKMIFNIPAIVLTNDYLKNNLGGYSIEWSDIADIQLSNEGYRSFASLIINLKDPEKYFNTPIKRIFYKTKQLFSVNDFSIRVDFVAGNNEEIFETIKAYWTMHYERESSL